MTTYLRAAASEVDMFLGDARKTFALMENFTRATRNDGKQTNSLSPFLSLPEVIEDDWIR